MSTADVFKERLKTVRQKLGLTQVQMAELIGVSRATIGFYENGDRLPDISVFESLVTATEIPASYYLGHTTSQKEEYADLSLITGLDDEAIGAILDADTYALSALLKHPAFMELIGYVSVFVNPVIMPDVSKGAIEIAQARAHICLGRILTAAINGELGQKDDDLPWYQHHLLLDVDLNDKELAAVFNYSSDILESISKLRKVTESRNAPGKGKQDIAALQREITADTERIKRLEERKRVCAAAIERIQAKEKSAPAGKITK